MRVVMGSSLLLLLLVVAELPPASPRKIDIPEDAGAQEEEEGFGFLTTTISSLSNMLGLGKAAEIDDPDETEDMNTPQDPLFDEDADDDFNEVAPKLQTDPNEVLKDGMQASPPAVEGFFETGVLGDEPAREDNSVNKPANEVDSPGDKEKEDPESLIEKDPAKPKPTEEEGDRDPPENADEEDPKSELEKKLDEIEEKEDEILNELGKPKLDSASPDRADSTGLILVNKMRPSGSSDSGLFPLVPDTNGSRGMMADRHYRTSPGGLVYRPSVMSPMLSTVSRRMQDCTNCLVSWDSPRCPMDDAAKELKQWIGELAELISYGCPNSCSDDGSKRCCYRREPDIESALTELTELAKQMHSLFESSCTKCPRGWGEWCEWGGCSTSCGMGTRTRSRQCHDPSRASCQGQSVETIPCSNPECCTDGNWSPWGQWSQCPVTCGTGMVNRMRSCSSPPPNYCGQPCRGSGQDARRCDTRRPCCVPRNGNWSPWNQWSRCSASCGRGSRERYRTCSNPPPNECGDQCFGMEREMDTCMERDCCVNGNWGSWGMWSQCSATCNSGTRLRRRQCDSPAPNHCGMSCPGSPTESDSCYAGVPCTPVCVDGNWGPWQPWSRCSATCGSGMQTRMRRCDNPSPNFCGQRCTGSPSDTKSCRNLNDCCVPRDGNWSPWSYWSPCSASCGPGSRDRSRTCDNPRPNECGRDCFGARRDTDRCEERPCCQDGNWGFWESWSAPSKSCGIATRERRRRCDSPPPDYCGRTCPGLGVETEEYNTRIPCDPPCVPLDGNWSPWSRWSPCSVSCGQGTRDRFRSCTNPSPNKCGRDCPRGADRETDQCYEDNCCIPQDGNWSPWSPWSSCPVTCGTSTVQRSRSCSNPPPNSCGRTCPGVPSDSKQCRRQPCCIPQDGNWSPWSRWSRCPVTCGTGRIERTRSCSNPPPNECGTSCLGSPRETDMCSEGPCCVDRTWTPWGPWSQPGVTCGTATRERRRRCEAPFDAPDCGRSCPGPDYERESYDSGVPCERCIDGNWSPWSYWSQCSRSCGEGMQDRERTCSNPPPNRCGNRCVGPAKDMRRCNERPCCIPQNGNWGSWTRWSTCSASCGQGTRDRTRMCNNPRPNECGRECPGPRQDTEMCEGPSCCVDGNWGFWGPWGRPSATCGPYTVQRRRRCDSPPADACGRDCPGSAVETRSEFHNIPCELPCVDGNWGQWGMWSQCTVSCGMGQVTRSRSCDSPRPNYCGRSCPGRSMDTTTRRCGPDMDSGNWGPWGPWGGCSRTCGGGQQTRRRRCDSFGACSSRCQGYDSDTQPCNQQSCCVTTWGPWSSCSATCEGYGTRERRQIAVGCRDPLFGMQTETEQCRVYNPPCERPADWSPWNNWCPCECKTGTRARRRLCRQLGSQVDISNCPGPAREEENCDVSVACPTCVESCRGRLDGEYPACTSCSDYIKCSNGRAGMLSCSANNYEYDGFIQKCVPPPSPSCTLVDCVSSCAGQGDGRYPSCTGCEYYIQCTRGRDRQMSCPPGQEFNAHTGQCVSGRSPTCIRAIRNTVEYMYRDAPADSYFPADELTEEERKALYMELRKKVGVAARFNRSDEDIFAEAEARRRDREREAEEEKKKEALKELLGEEEEEEEEEELEEEEEEEKRKEALEELLEEEEEEREEKEEGLDGTVVIEEDNADEDNEVVEKPQIKDIEVHRSGSFKCQKTCEGVEMGRYQSCKGCRYFLVCTKHRQSRHVKCPRHTHWDDIKKKCTRHSSTCKHGNITRP